MNVAAMDRLTSMEVFARVVEAESYTAAAERLGMSRAAVSKRVIQLEDRLGVRLLNRTTRRVMPTSAGLAYYDRCTRVLAEANEADDIVKRLRSEPSGTLRINAAQSFGTLHLGPAIAEFATAYPDIDVSLTLNDRFVNLIEEGSDVAIRIADRVPPALGAKRIAPIRIAVCASPGYLSREGEPSKPGDLASHRCLRYSYLSSGDNWHFIGPEGSQSVRIAGHFSANNGDVLRQAAIGGLGIAHLPTFIVSKELREGALVRVLAEYRVPELSLYAVFAGEGRPALPITLLLNFLEEKFGAAPYWDRDLPN